MIREVENANFNSTFSTSSMQWTPYLLEDPVQVHSFIVTVFAMKTVLPNLEKCKKMTQKWDITELDYD